MINLLISECNTNTIKSWIFTEFSATFLENFNERLIRIGINVERNVLRIIFQPNFFHVHYSFSLVGTAGFEPATTCAPCKCATKLRHAPLFKNVLPKTMGFNTLTQ